VNEQEMFGRATAPPLIRTITNLKRREARA